MNLMEIQRQAKRNRWISMIICVSLVFSVFAASVQDVSANPIAVPVVSELGAALYQAMAAGLQVNDVSALNAILYGFEYDPAMEEARAIANAKYEAWLAEGKITLSQAEFESLQASLNAITSQNTVIMDMMNDNIYQYLSESGVWITYLKSNSALAPLSNEVYLIADFQQILLSSGWVDVTPNFRVKRVSVGNYDYLQYAYYINEVWNTQTVGPSARELDVDMPVSFAVAMKDISIAILVSGYWKGNPRQYSSYSQSPTGTTGTTPERNRIKNLIVDEILTLGAVTPITYNVYNPTYNNNNDVEIPWPAGLTWEDLIGKSGQQIFDGPDTNDPGEPVDRDYTGVLGSILGTLGGIKDKVVEGFQGVGDFFADIPAAITAAFAGLFDWTKHWRGPTIGGGIGAFLNPLIALLIAIMALMVKVLAFIGQLYGIPASSAMLHPTMVQGLVWARGFHTAGGVNLYGLITGVISIVFGIVVFKLLRKIITGIGTASFSEAPEAQWANVWKNPDYYPADQLNKAQQRGK